MANEVANPNTAARAEKLMASVIDIVNSSLPSNITREKFRDTFLTAAKKEPKILTADAKSVQLALIASASSGLLPDGKMAAMVPFKSEIQFIIMVMGYIHLFKKFGGVHSMAVNVIYEKDEFEYIEGDDTVLRHKPNVLIDPSERGGMVGVYAIFKDSEGRVMHREVMGKAAVMKAKAVSKMSGGPWKDFEEEMWRKTVVRRAAKYLPLTQEAIDILDREDRATIDFDLPARQINQDYNPLTIAAGVQNDEADEDGVVYEQQAQISNDDPPFEQDQQEEEHEEALDTDNIVDGTAETVEQKPVEKPVEKAVEKPVEKQAEIKEKPAATTRATERQLDDAWNRGVDAKQDGQPRDVPDDITHPDLIKTFQSAWDKAEVKKKPQAEGKAAPQATDVTRDARAKALDGAERQAPSDLSEEDAAEWLKAYDQQVKDAEANG